MRPSLFRTGCAAAVAMALGTNAVAAAAPPAADLAGFKHVVVIYEENHSFDNLYGNWGAVGGEPTNGRANATAAKTVQVRQDNATAYGCLLQDDVNLTSPSPLSSPSTRRSTLM